MPDKDPMLCPRCEAPTEYAGTKTFAEERGRGVFGGFGELFADRSHFDVYVCQRCGRVEFFIDGVGEEFRPH